jgi:TP901 family phage tail tape measure protein
MADRENLEVGISANVDGDAETRRLADAVSSVSDALREISSIARTAATSTDRVERSLSGAQRAARSGTAAVNAQAEAYRRLGQAQQGVSSARHLSTDAPSIRQTVAENSAQTRAGSGLSTDASRNRARPQALASAVGLDQDYQQASSAMRAYYADAERAATASQRANAEFLRSAHALSAQRYALYDVSNAFTVAGAAIGAVGIASAATAIQMERSFANVLRTQDSSITENVQSVDALRESFNELYKSIPASFADLTDIGTLGGQLGVAESELANFTETVAQFAATTDVTAEASATAFGRLSQLLPDVGSNYEALGNAILTTGVNSVATESAIISVSQEIAATASQYGFAADETIGIASAFSSLGIAAESARGTFLRTTGQINKAVSNGGAALDRFAAIANMSSEEFADSWRGDPVRAFQSFLAGVNEQGTAGQATLQALGITAQRDGNNLLKLAQNGEVLNQALADSAEGFAGNGELARQYGIITSTVAEKLNVLKNNFNEFVGSLGAGANGLGLVIDGAIGLLKLLDALVSNPVGQFIAGVGISLAVVVGGFGLFIGVVARGRAALFALNAALADMVAAQAAGTVASTTLTGSIRSLTTQLYGTSAAARVAGASFSVATSAARLLGVAFAALTVLQVGTYFLDLNTKARQASEGLRTVQDATTQLSNATIADSFRAANGALEESNSKFGIAATLIGKLAGQDLPLLGDSLDRALNAKRYGALDEIAAVDDQLASLVSSGNGDKAAEIIEQSGVSAEQAAQLLPNYQEALKAVKEEAGVAADELTDLKDALDEAFAPQNTIADFLGDFQTLLDGIATGGAAFDAFSSAGSTNLQNLQASIATTIAAGATLGINATDSVSALFTRLKQEGVDTAKLLASLSGTNIPGVNFDAVSAATTATKSDQLSDSTSNLLGLLGKMRGVSANAGKGLDGVGKAAEKAAKKVVTLKDYANDLQEVFSRSFDLRFGGQIALDEIATSWQDIADKNAEAAKQAKDYNQTIAETRADIQGLQADIASLTADKAIQEYFLKVAENYGDVLRAGDIRADIGQIDADIAAKRADLAGKTGTLNDTQAELNALTNTTTGTQIEQRASLNALVQQYQGYIVQLASSGLSQEQLAARTAELKQEFINQATQLGFTRGTVLNAAKAFDDMTYAISRVPRNVTVTADTNPAVQAMNELRAKLDAAAASSNNLRANLAGGYSIPAPDIAAFQAANAKAARADALRAQAAGLSSQYQKAVASGADNVAVRLLEQMNAIAERLRSGNYASGGYTGNGGKYEPAGTVHKGEFVMTKEATSRIGVSNLMAMMNNRSLSSAPTVNVTAGSSAAGVQAVTLDASSLQAIQALGNPVIVMNGRVVGQVISGENLNQADLGRNG